MSARWRTVHRPKQWSVLLSGAGNPSRSTLDVREVVVELAQVVVPLVVHSGEDAAAGQLGEILGGTKGKLSGTTGVTGG